MDRKIAFRKIEESGVFVALRGNFPPDYTLSLIEAMIDEGLTVFEFTMNSVQPIEAMQAAKREFGDEILVGMGTCLSVESARRAIDAGAEYVVSPAFQRDVVAYVNGTGQLMVPGVLTPSEAVEAWEMGVPLLKLFPIGSLGVDFFKAFFAPLDHMKFTCNGAIDDKLAHDFIHAGATAVGMAGWLSGDGTWPPSRLRSRARILRNAIESARTGQPPVYEA